ncbi:MAG TPA: hemolysin family protein [Dehalococcoidia bacterium]|nr:hemolysin family protein [Dehalococcoidia bacterium]
MTIPLILIVLIAVNALYVAAEFSTVSARRSRIRQLAQEGNRSASWLLPVVENPQRLDRYVAACQIGITLSSLVLGAYGQAALPGVISPLLSDLGAIREGGAQAASATIILIGLTSLQVLFGELLPKSLALQFTTQVALLCSVPMAISLRLFSWFIAILNGSGVAILRLLGTGDATHRHIHSPEEIQLLLVESRDGGLLEPDEQRRLLSALSLGEQSVRALMVPRTRVVCVDADLPMEEIEGQMLDNPYTRFPVFREAPDNIIGVLHSKDLVRRRLEDDSMPTIEELVKEPVFVPGTVPADRAIAMLREQHSQQAIIIDEYGGFEGMATIEDLLSEVLNIKTIQSPAAEKLADGRIRVSGSMRLDQAAMWIGSQESDAETVAGFVIERLGHIPDPEEFIEVNDIRIEVESVAEHAIRSLLITPVAAGA